MLAAGGAVLPLLAGTPLLDSLSTFARIEDNGAGKYGYVLFALAGAMVIGDKLFGLSSRWMRYMITATVLARRRAEFEMDWGALWLEIGAAAPTVEQQSRAISMLRGFRIAVVSEVEEETRVWVAEFESGLAQLERFTRYEQRAATTVQATERTSAHGPAQTSVSAINHSSRSPR